jgi:hypothetical protein
VFMFSPDACCDAVAAPRRHDTASSRFAAPANHCHSGVAPHH